MTGGGDGWDGVSRTVEAGVVAGHPNRYWIDVAREYCPVQRLRRRNRQHAGAGAEVEHAPRTISLQHGIEQQQAAARGAMMADAERQRRLDLDAGLVGR